MSEVVILLGAGATVSDVATRAKTSRPPLDRNFFSLSRAAGYATQVGRISDYMSRTYGIDIRSPEYDSLESVMGQIYTDLFNSTLASTARTAFLALLRLFNERLATTTNNIAATQKRFLYRIVSYYLATGLHPGQPTILTFNQDLQAEKILELLASKSKWSSLSPEIFNFPGCYELDVPPHRLTSPTAGSAPELFEQSPYQSRCIRILKLHGSLNWYSTHNSRSPSIDAMFNQSRRLSITRRRDIYVDMTVSGPSRTTYTLPVVIPPVTHKSSVLHDRIRDVWSEAESRLTTADHLVVFGYSCPPLDFESTNMLRRSQLAARHDRSLALIDPDPATASRYISLLSPQRLSCYPSAEAFLNDHAH